MKRHSQRTGYSSLAELNVTPLIDLAFVLLITFMITAPLLEQSIEVQTPDAAARDTPPLDPAKVRTITVDARGQIYLEGDPVPDPEFHARLRALKDQVPGLAVGIRADRGISYQRVVDVIDSLQAAGIAQFGLVTTPEASR